MDPWGRRVVELVGGSWGEPGGVVEEKEKNWKDSIKKARMTYHSKEVDRNFHWARGGDEGSLKVGPHPS